MIAHGKGFKFHAQPQTGAYSCFVCCNTLSDFGLLFLKISLPTEKNEKCF